jgi:hypothetical protein
VTEPMLSVTLTLSDPQVDDEQLQVDTLTLRDQIAEVEGVNDVYTTPAAQAPANAKSIGGAIINVLTAEITPQALMSVLNFLGGRLFNRSIEIEAEANGKTLKVRVSNAKDLEFAIEQAKRFLEG